MQIPTGARRTANVHAITAAKLAVLPRKDLETLIRENPALLEQMMKIIRRHLRRNLMAEIFPTIFGPMDEDCTSSGR